MFGVGGFAFKKEYAKDYGGVLIVTPETSFKEIITSPEEQAADKESFTDAERNEFLLDMRTQLKHSKDRLTDMIKYESEFRKEYEGEVYKRDKTINPIFKKLEDVDNEEARHRFNKCIELIHNRQKELKEGTEWVEEQIAHPTRDTYLVLKLWYKDHYPDLYIGSL